MTDRLDQVEALCASNTKALDVLIPAVDAVSQRVLQMVESGNHRDLRYERRFLRITEVMEHMGQQNQQSINSLAQLMDRLS
ncbi:MAG: hypothetical protein ACFB16_08280 [Phormidesmis sp.]